MHLAASKRHPNILRMLEEHSGGNYPLPRLQRIGESAIHISTSTDEKNLSNLENAKHKSHSTESVNNILSNIAPSTYYKMNQMEWRYVFSQNFTNLQHIVLKLYYQVTFEL